MMILLAVHRLGNAFTSEEILEWSSQLLSPKEHPALHCAHYNTSAVTIGQGRRLKRGRHWSDCQALSLGKKKKKKSSTFVRALRKLITQRES